MDPSPSGLVPGRGPALTLEPGPGAGSLPKGGSKRRSLLQMQHNQLIMCATFTRDFFFFLHGFSLSDLIAHHHCFHRRDPCIGTV